MEFMREEDFKGKPHVIFRVSPLKQIRVAKDKLTAEQKKLMPKSDK